jgi:DNA-binding NarL/FixJ family response regulator
VWVHRLIVTPVRTGVSPGAGSHHHPWSVTDGSETTTRRTRVFVADGHASYREGMASLLRAHPALDMVGDAADGTAALAGILRLQPDVALLDVGMAGLTGLEVCRRLHADGAEPHTRVVLITGAPDRDVAAAAADAGAIALLAKETPPGSLVAELVAAGQGRVARAVE